MPGVQVAMLRRAGGRAKLPAGLLQGLPAGKGAILDPLLNKSRGMAFHGRMIDEASDDRDDGVDAGALIAPGIRQRVDGIAAEVGQPADGARRRNRGIDFVRALGEAFGHSMIDTIKIHASVGEPRIRVV